MKPARILYVDFAPSPGGSILSLTHLLEHLPRHRFTPIALLSPTVASLPALTALDIPIFSYDARQGIAAPFRPATQQLRSSTTASWLRERRWLGAPWRWGSILRRLWLRTRPTAARIAEIIDTESIDLVHLNDALPLAEPGILGGVQTRSPQHRHRSFFHRPG